MIRPVQNNVLNNMAQVAAQGNPGRPANQRYADQLLQNAAAPAKGVCQRFADWIREIFQSLFSCCKKSPEQPTQTPVTPTNNQPNPVPPVNPNNGGQPLVPEQLVPPNNPVAGNEMVGQAQELILPGGTRLRILVGDITQQRTHVVVNAANEGGLGGLGIDEAINRAGGARLIAERQALPLVGPNVRIPAGEARMTHAGDMTARGIRYVAHAVGTRWPAGIPNNIQSLQDANLTPAQQGILEPIIRQQENAYQQALTLAHQNPLANEGDEPNRSISFPLISSGYFGWSRNFAVQVALEAIIDWNYDHPGAMREIRMVLFNDGIYNTALQSAQTVVARNAGQFRGNQPLLAQDAQLQPIQNLNL